MLAKFLQTPQKLLKVVRDALSTPPPQTPVPATPAPHSQSSAPESVSDIVKKLSGGLNKQPLSPREPSTDFFARLIVGQGLEIVDLRGVAHLFKPEGDFICYYVKTPESQLFVRQFDPGVAEIQDELLPAIRDIFFVNQVSVEIIDNIINHFHSISDAGSATNHARDFLGEDEIFLRGEASCPRLEIKMDAGLGHIVVNAFVDDALKCLFPSGKCAPGKLTASANICYVDGATPKKSNSYGLLTTPGMSAIEETPGDGSDRPAASRLSPVVKVLFQ